jgi:hypothetical protein
MTAPRPLEERFWEKVDKNGPIPVNRPELGPCWLWTAYVAENGYGKFEGDYAHRIAYRLCVGPIPERKDLDHLCRLRRCANPKHTEPVTRIVNILRGEGHGTETHCSLGHPYSGDNLYVNPNTGKRYCRTCNRLNAARIRQERRQLV